MPLETLPRPVAGLLAVLICSTSAGGQQFVDRWVERIDFVPVSGDTHQVEVVLRLASNASGSLDLGSVLTLTHNGSAVATISVPANFPGGFTCGQLNPPNCSSGSCNRPYICREHPYHGGCSCQIQKRAVFDNNPLNLSLFDEVQVSVAPAPGATPDTETGNDVRDTDIFFSRISGQGLGSSCQRAVLKAGGDLLTWSLKGNPGDILLGAIANQCEEVNPLQLTPRSEVDIELSSLQLIFDGTGTVLPPTFITSFLHVPASGSFELGLTADFSPGPQFVTQTALLGPAYPAGVATTNAISVEAFDDPCTSASQGNDLGLSDNDSQFIAFTGANPSFDYYGLTYTGFWVNANGNVTFCGASPDFTPTVAEFLGDMSSPDAEPRIAPAWADFNPSAAGSVNLQQSDDTVKVMWCGVPVSGCNEGRNSFALTLDKTNGEIRMDWGRMAWCSGTWSNAAIVGLSPGFDAPAGCPAAPILPVTSEQTDLFPGTTAGTGPFDALYEVFLGTGGSAWDLNGRTQVFAPISTGPGTVTYQDTTP